MIELTPIQNIPILPVDGDIPPEMLLRRDKLSEALIGSFAISPNPSIVLRVDTSGLQNKTDVLLANSAFGDLSGGFNGITFSDVCKRFVGEDQTKALLSDVSEIVESGKPYCETLTPTGKLVQTTVVRDLDDPNSLSISMSGSDIRDLLADEPGVLSTVSSFWRHSDAGGFILNRSTIEPVSEGQPETNKYLIIRSNEMNVKMPFNITKDKSVLRMLNKAQKGEFANEEIIIENPGESPKIYRVLAYRGSDGDKYVVSVRDITNEAKNFRLLENAANYDMVSGLLRRDRMTEDINNLDEERKEKGIDNLALVFLDVDHFKEVNDTRGHVTGDYYLALIAFVSALSTRGSVDRIWVDFLIYLILLLRKVFHIKMRQNIY